jgi:hypothetical protein
MTDVLLRRVQTNSTLEMQEAGSIEVRNAVIDWE